VGVPEVTNQHGNFQIWKPDKLVAVRIEKAEGIGRAIFSVVFDLEPGEELAIQIDGLKMDTQFLKEINRHALEGC
jgi:hypothetical protein